MSQLGCAPRRRWLLVAAALFAAVGVSRPAGADCTGAQAFVQDAADRSLAVLNAPGADDAQRLAGMNQLLFELADVPLIARLVLGRVIGHCPSKAPQYPDLGAICACKVKS